MDPRHRLSGVSPSEFTKARDALVKELRAAGQEQEAKRIAALRKPPAALWVANQLGRRAPKAVAALIDAAEKLKRAHGKGHADALRAAMQEQRESLHQLLEAARQAAAEIGARATVDLERRVQSTAQAAAASNPQALRDGTLDQELAPSGFEALQDVKIAEQPAAKKHEEERAARERSLAEETAQRLAAEADDLERAAALARDRALEARRKSDEAAARARKKP